MNSENPKSVVVPETPKAPAVIRSFYARSLTVQTRDGNSETVHVDQVGVAEYMKFSQCLHDEAKLIELTCRKEAGWADTLSIEGWEQILSAIEELNFKYFVSWLERQRKRMRLMNPEFAEAAEKSLLSSLQKIGTTAPKEASQTII